MKALLDVRWILRHFFQDSPVNRLLCRHPIPLSPSLVQVAAAAFRSWVFEKSLPWREAPPRPEGVAIEITNSCNLRCTMCNIVKMQRPPKMMPMETYLKVLNRCAEAKIKSIRLHTYGETLLHPRLPEMIREAAQRQLSVWISTNAQLLDEKRGRGLLEAGVDTVRYSVEGTTRETYERIRKGGSWETLLRNMKQFKALRDELRPQTRLCLNMILMKDTLEESERVDEVFGHLVDEIVLSPLEGLGDHGRELSSGQWLEEVDDTHRHSCRLLWEMMNISVDGKATLCCADLEAANVVGDATTEDFGSIWKGSKLESFRRLHRQGKFQQIGICSNCSFGSTNSVANRFRYSLLNEKSAKRRFQMR